MDKDCPPKVTYTSLAVTTWQGKQPRSQGNPPHIPLKPKGTKPPQTKINF